MSGLGFTYPKVLVIMGGKDVNEWAGLAQVWGDSGRHNGSCPKLTCDAVAQDEDIHYCRHQHLALYRPQLADTDKKHGRPKKQQLKKHA